MLFPWFYDVGYEKITTIYNHDVENEIDSAGIKGFFGVCVCVCVDIKSKNVEDLTNFS